jgi:hypothetical protein
MVMIAGIFAFMPVQEASTVHTTIQQATTHLVDTDVEQTANNDNFLITCPATSDGCIINEIIAFDDTTGGSGEVDTIFLGLVDANITATSFQLAAAGDNVGPAATDTLLVLTGVSGLAIGAGDTVCVNMTGTFTDAGDNYGLNIIATVEGDLSDITAVAQVAACA